MKKLVLRAFALAMTLALLAAATLGNATIVVATAPTTTSPSALTVTTKPLYPTVTRQVWDTHTNSWTSWTTAAIGDTIFHRIESIVPLMTGFSSYVFTLEESLRPGLTFDISSVVVRVGGVPVTEGIDYTLQVLPQGQTNSFNIIFNPAIFASYAPGDIIEVLYSGTLANVANFGTAGNLAETILQFSNDPQNSSSITRTAPAITNVFTLNFFVYKYTGTLGTDDRGLAGAEFELRTDPADPTTAIAFARLNIGNQTQTAAFRVYAPPAGNRTQTMLTPESGRLHVSGLDAGVYYLIETVAPVGFNILEHPVRIVITNPNGDGEAVVTADGNPTVHRTVNVLNNAGTTLPGTGGIGNTIFIITGLSIMGFAAVLLFWRRKALVAK